MLKMKLVGAASLAVMTSTALAACGSGDSAETKKAEVDETTYAEAQAEPEAEVDQPSSYAPEDTATAYGSEPLETEAEPATNYETAQQSEDLEVTSSDPYATDDATQTALEETGNRLDEVGATLASLTPMKASDVRSKDDVTLITDSAFEKADLNGDGSLDRTEFATLSLAAAGEDPSVISTVLTKAEEVASDMVDGVTGAEADSETGVDAGTAMPAEEAAQVAALEEDFVESAGDDAAMTKEELRAAFLARFEKADVNENEQLETEESEVFAALTAGKKEE